MERGFEGIPTVGGLASGDSNEHLTQVYLNGDVFEEGLVAISVGGEVRLASVRSQVTTRLESPRPLAHSASTE